jgi:hypothetical protein
MNASVDRDIGSLSARLAAVEEDLHELRKDVREIRDAIVKFRGGWAAMAVIFAAGGTLGGLGAKLWSVLGQQ